jgi:hypothetical protein
MDLTNNAVVSLSALGLAAPDFNIRAVTSDTTTVQSVRFGYFNNTNFRVESSAPFAFCGDTNGVYTKCNELGLGTQIVTATPFSAKAATGTAGSMVSVTFQVVQGPAPPAPLPVPTKAPVAPPVPAPVPAPIPAPIPSPIAAPTPTATTPSKLTLKLVDTASSREVFDLFDGAVVNIAALGLTTRNFNINAVAVDNTVQSVKFTPNNRVESGAPFAYCKLAMRDY